MLLAKPEIIQMFKKIALLWNENKDYLSQIDSRFGDGDHGITIGKIASLMEKSIEGWEDHGDWRRQRGTVIRNHDRGPVRTVGGEQTH